MLYLHQSDRPSLTADEVLFSSQKSYNRGQSVKCHSPHYDGFRHNFVLDSKAYPQHALSLLYADKRPDAAAVWPYTGGSQHVDGRLFSPLLLRLHFLLRLFTIFIFVLHAAAW